MSGLSIERRLVPFEIDEKVERRAAYGALTSVFMAAFAGYALYQNRKRGSVQLSTLDLLQLGLASYRLGRLVSYDKVAETYRSPFARTVPDPSGADMTVVPRGQGMRAAIGEMIACPICSGTWIAAGLVYGLGLLPRPTRILLNIMSSIGLAELFNAVTEALQWTGQLQRERAGSERMAKSDGQHREPEESPAHPRREIATHRFEDRIELTEHEYPAS